MSDRTCTTPCSTCPWRKASAGGSDIPSFDIELARKLRNTVGDGDGFRNIMACHWSTEGAETACLGYVFVEGYSNINVRLAMTDGRIAPFSVIDEACEDIDLYESFDEMLEALEETA